MQLPRVNNYDEPSILLSRKILGTTKYSKIQILRLLWGKGEYFNTELRKILNGEILILQLNRKKS
jgi:hypothetical protein